MLMKTQRYVESWDKRHPLLVTRCRTRVRTGEYLFVFLFGVVRVFISPIALTFCFAFGLFFPSAPLFPALLISKESPPPLSSKCHV